MFKLICTVSLLNLAANRIDVKQVSGYEVKEISQNKILFAPDDGSFEAIVVLENSCKYANVAFHAGEGQLRGTATARQPQAIPPIRTGKSAWCLLDSWGYEDCSYASMSQCLRAMTKSADKNAFCAERFILDGNL